ncbi:MAG: prepilin-type N-terminal cleavage/methylation domain-containing protein [Gemmatimonadota bacterium]|jgi:prepilin-type N-terminal cleavage/methylation domain-containing protein
MTRDRRGFTIVELLTVAVLGSLLLLAVYQILVTNQRTYRENAEQVNAQQTLRVAMDILAAELQEISTAGGDLVTVSTTSLDYWALSRFGLVCGIDYGPPVVLTVRKAEAFFDSGDRIIVFADNDEDFTTDDAWIPALVTAIDTTGVTCDGEVAQDLTFGAQQARFTADSVRTGAPIRSQVASRVGKVEYGGQPYLALERNGVTSPIAGPLDGLRFDYYDEDGNTTGNASEVHRIEVSIAAGTRLTMTVYPRN